MSGPSNDKILLETTPKKRLNNPRTNKYINDVKIEFSPKSKEFVRKPTGELFLKGKVIGFSLPKGEMSSVSESSE